MQTISNKIKIKLALALAAIGVLGVGVAWRASAETVEISEAVEATVVETAKDPLSINKTVNGDVICASLMRCEIKGAIKGDVLAAAPEVVISAEVDGNIRAAGNNVTIAQTAKITKNLSLFAQSQLKIEQGASVNQDAMLLSGQTARIAGKIGRDLTMTGSENYLEGEVGRHVNITSSHYTLVGSSAKIGGDLSDTSENSSIERSVVAGNISTNKYDQKQGKNQLVSTLSWLLGVALMLLLVKIFAPKNLRQFADAEFKLGDVFLVASGIGILLLLPLLALIGFAGEVLGGVAFLILSLWLLLVALSLVVGLYSLAKLTAKTLDKAHNERLVLLIGLGVYGLLLLEPTISLFAHIILIGFGAGVCAKLTIEVLRTNFNNNKKHKKVA